MKKSTLIAEFDQATYIVDSSFPSLYTKEDVIKVLRDLEAALKVELGNEEETETVSKGLTKDQVQEIADAIASEIRGEGTDLISDYDLSMSYREVELDSVEFDEDGISRIAKRAIEGIIEYSDDNA
jgi:ATP-dependent protease HslVU (ClpYQ) ATPase subunit